MINIKRAFLIIITKNPAPLVYHNVLMLQSRKVPLWKPFRWQKTKQRKLTLGLAENHEQEDLRKTQMDIVLK